MPSRLENQFDLYSFSAEEVQELKKASDLYLKFLINERTMLIIQRANVSFPQGKDDEGIRTLEYLRGRIETFNFLIQMTED